MIEIGRGHPSPVRIAPAHQHRPAQPRAFEHIGNTPDPGGIGGKIDSDGSNRARPERRQIVAHGPGPPPLGPIGKRFVDAVDFQMCLDGRNASGVPNEKVAIPRQRAQIKARRFRIDAIMGTPRSVPKGKTQI